MTRRLLLLSSSYVHGHGFLEHSKEHIRTFFNGCKKIAFVPYALKDQDAYAAKVQAAFAQLFQMQVISVHQGDPVSIVQECDGIFIGGGNTFRLLNLLYKNQLIPVIRKRVLEEDMPYMGSSAGTNIAAPTIKTTNDMPIVFPPSFDALNLVNFQINPHFLDADPNSKHQGETREQRLQEFHEENDTPVVGIREGAIIHVQKEKMEIIGANGAKLFLKVDKKVVDLAQGGDLAAHLGL